MQVRKFPNGGYAVHKIRLPGFRLHYSAWYGPDGTLIDAEAIDSIGRTRSLPEGEGVRRRALTALFSSIKRAYP